jgi:ABC-type branched-subunit amino acid transport system substrate-binding protein
VSYESKAEPIKIGFLYDFKLPEGDDAERSRESRLLFRRPFELIFREGKERGIIDRDVEILYKEVEGLPKGTIKAVIDGYHELVEAGCLLILGPMITDNCVPLRPVIERLQVPSISMTGAEDYLGEWTFALPQGSMTDEPVVWAHLIARRGFKTVGAFVEQSLIGESYLKYFRAACRAQGLSIVSVETIPQTGQEVRLAAERMHAQKPDAVVHCGFGFGALNINPALAALDWDPPRFMGTAFQNAWINPVLWKAIMGWIGLDQYDEGNLVGQAFLDRYEAAYGSRPEMCVPVMNHDFANVMLQALADARPLTPLGVKEALERIKMLPAAAGAPGTRISFGNWMRRGWVGAGYLVARKLDPDGINSHLVERFGSES